MTGRRAAWLALLFVLILSGCQTQVQNRIRQEIQNLSSQRLYIQVYALDGTPIYEGIVDGGVSRAPAAGNEGETLRGDYIYWFDERGRYHQTDMFYLLTTYDIRGRISTQEP